MELVQENHFGKKQQNNHHQQIERERERASKCDFQSSHNRLL